MTAKRRSPRSAASAGRPEDLFALGTSEEREGGLRPDDAAFALQYADVAPGETAASAVSVMTLTRTIKDVLEGAFPPMWVRGEVTDFKQHRNGHWYFALRDREASLRCVVWSRDTRGIPAPPDEGMSVVALGTVTVYAARGDLQFAVKTMDAVGDGLWRKAFEATRARLEGEGLLDPARKRPLPFLPKTIAVITSADGAALHDIVSVARRRNPQVELVLIPAAVQGETAPASLCAALDRLAAWGGADVAIIGRGGGSREDLWSFNDERVARKVAASAIPIISAVGHEVDISICDLVADWRAPTPSAAAERAVPVLADVRRAVATLGRQLQDGAGSVVRQARRRLEQSARRSGLAARRIVEHRRLELEGTAGRLHALSPLATMARGYVVATTPDGTLLTSAAALHPGEGVAIRFRDGRVDGRVEQVHVDATNHLEER